MEKFNSLCEFFNQIVKSAEASDVDDATRDAVKELYESLIDGKYLFEMKHKTMCGERQMGFSVSTILWWCALTIMANGGE